MGNGWAEVDEAGNGSVGASNIQTASGELAREMSAETPMRVIGRNRRCNLSPK
jgi:hypothetical protein